MPKTLLIHLYVLISDRNLWWAVQQRGGPWPAVRPHCPCIHCHPWVTTRWRHSEQVREPQRVIMGVTIYTLCWEITPCCVCVYVCCRRNCIISAYYQQRETHKPTVPNVSIIGTSVQFLLLLKKLFVSACKCKCFLHYLCVQGLGASWEAPPDFIFKDPQKDCNQCWYLQLFSSCVQFDKKKKKKGDGEQTGMFVYIMLTSSILSQQIQCKNRSNKAWYVYIYTRGTFCKTYSETLTQQQISASYSVNRKYRLKITACKTE